MAKAVRGRLIRRVKVRDFKETLAIPAANKSLFRDGHDTPVVVQTGRDERRVDLGVSSGGEFLIPRRDGARSDKPCPEAIAGSHRSLPEIRADLRF